MNNLQRVPCSLSAAGLPLFLPPAASVYIRIALKGPMPCMEELHGTGEDIKHCACVSAAGAWSCKSSLLMKKWFSGQAVEGKNDIPHELVSD